MIADSGARTKEIKNTTPVVTAVRPFRPPSPIPTSLSTYEVMVLVPISNPKDLVTYPEQEQ